jgi:hypothetical protein
MEVKNMSVYPDWVTKHRKPGTSVKKVGDSYYLYKTTSARIPGKKNPQPKSEYIDHITRNGVEASGIRKLQTQTCKVYEYGFSRALEKLWPEKTDRDVGDKKKARDVFLNVVMKHSDRSYLLRGDRVPTPEELHVCICAYEKKFERLTGTRIKDLFPLSHIYLVEMGGKEIISQIDPPLFELMKELEVSL